MSSAAVMPTYGRLPVAFERGEGAWLYDANDDAYLDALSGIAVCVLGHAHPAVADTLAEQSRRLIHTSNLYDIPQQERLAEKLVELSGLTNVFFGNSGAEANEAAIKLARMYGHGRDITEPAIVVMEGAFHGRTMATLSASGSRKVQAGFEPLLSGFVRCPWNDLEALEAIVQRNPNVVAVMLEPIQGEGGLRIPDEGYLKGIRRICDDSDLLMMLDEVQAGNGRTGTYFCFQHEDILPDVIMLSKGLGNGVPIGACIAGGAAAELFQPGNHGSTFGGNPLSCAAAGTVVETILAEGLPARAAHLGEKMLADFRQKLAGLDCIREIRGRGLMMGIELDRPCTELVGMALEEKLLINVTADCVIRLLPPLTISDEEAGEIVSRLSTVIHRFAGS